MKLTKDQELQLKMRYGHSDAIQLLIDITNSSDIEYTIKLIGEFIEIKTKERMELLEKQKKGEKITP